MRLRRNKICVDDFELLAIIGRGAFGEVGSMLAYESFISVLCSFQNISKTYMYFLCDILVYFLYKNIPLYQLISEPPPLEQNNELLTQPDNFTNMAVFF